MISLPFSLLRPSIFQLSTYLTLATFVYLAPPTSAAPATVGDLVISEIHYNPYAPTAEEIKANNKLKASDFEFLEIHNVSSVAVTMTGVTISGGIDIFTFLDPLILPAGGYTVVASKPSAFALRYPLADTPGNYKGRLSNDGDQLIVTSAANVVILDVTYGVIGQWPGRPNGRGSSLELIDHADAAADFNAADTWRASSEFNGSPGSAGTGSDRRIVINEVSSNTDLPAVDTIELYNTTGAPITIGSWLLTDNSSVYPSFVIPATTIAAGAYVTFNESDFNVAPTLDINSYSSGGLDKTTVGYIGHGLSTGETITISGYGGTGLYNGSWQVTVTNVDHFTIPTAFIDNNATKGKWTTGRPFGLSSTNGEDLWLMETDAHGKPAKFIDHIDFAAAFSGDTLGRWPNGTGSSTLVSMTSDTLGSVNLGAQVGPIIISEVMYAPLPPVGQPEAFFEFVEIFNSGEVTENLVNWRMRGGADFDFTASQSLDPGDALMVVAFDPITNAAAATAFRNHYNIDTSIPLIGPFLDGPLGNTNGTVRLQRPDTPPITAPLLYPQVTEDEVRYENQAPWPTNATGSGASINRIGNQRFGNFATSWSGNDATPGGKRLYYNSWIESYFGNTPPPSSGQAEDYESDGTPNLVEFGLNLNPIVADAYLVPPTIKDGGNATITYERDLLRTDISYRVQYSTDLTTWDTAAESILSTTNFTEIRKATAPNAPDGKMFMRIIVESP